MFLRKVVKRIPAWKKMGVQGGSNREIAVIIRDEQDRA